MSTCLPKKPLQRTNQKAFTLIELLLVISIIAILLAIGVPRYNSMVNKASEGSTKGNLGTLRSALAIYFGDNSSETYPLDDLTSLTLNMKYLPAIPAMKTPPYHATSTFVTAESAPSDSGNWSYNNVQTDITWGSVDVGCTHQDLTGAIWTSY